MHLPKPKTADWSIICISVTLLGASEVIGADAAHNLQLWLFWGGIVGLSGLLVWHVIVWLWNLARGSVPKEQGQGIDNKGGNFVGRDNSGALTIHNAPVTIYHAPPAAVEDGRQFVPVGVTPERIMSFYDENTSLQANKLTKDFIGQWMRVNGTVAHVAPVGEGSAMVGFKETIGKNTAVLICFFVEPWLDHLHLLKVGDKITVIGQFQRIDLTSFVLGRCEIVAETE